jgi:hypothetical protein
MSKNKNMIIYIIIIVLILIAGYMIYSKKSFENFASGNKSKKDSQTLYNNGAKDGWAFIKNQMRYLMSINKNEWTNAYPLGYFDGIICAIDYYNKDDYQKYKVPHSPKTYKKFIRKQLPNCPINDGDIY